MEKKKKRRGEISATLGCTWKDIRIQDMALM